MEIKPIHTVKYSANDAESAFPIHTGWLLKEEIEYGGFSQRDFADQIGISYAVRNGMLNEKRPVTWEKTILFEEVLGIDSKMIMSIQYEYIVPLLRKGTKFLSKIAQLRKIPVAM